MSTWFRANSLPLALALLFWSGVPALAQQGGCAPCGVGYANCQGKCGPGKPCPPHFKWWVEGPPRICYKCACPRPVCDPCSLEHFGYYQTCWSPWPYPPDWSHCPTPPSGAVLPPPPYPPYTPRTPRDPNYPQREYRDGDLPAPTPAPAKTSPPPISPLPDPVPKTDNRISTSRVTPASYVEPEPITLPQVEPQQQVATVITHTIKIRASSTKE